MCKTFSRQDIAFLIRNNRQFYYRFRHFTKKINRYVHHLQNTLSELLQDLPLQLRRDMWFMHDGAAPHFSLNIRNHLNQQYPNKWISRGHDARVKCEDFEQLL